jgi:hypothetical protein
VRELSVTLVGGLSRAGEFTEQLHPAYDTSPPPSAETFTGERWMRHVPRHVGKRRTAVVNWTQSLERVSE